MKKVVIIGGGFSGAYIARKLEREFDVTIVDTKDYFEFTPGVLRTIVEPWHVRKIQVIHSHYLKKAHIVRGKARDITSKEVIVGNKRLQYDYMVICSGSRYSSPFKEKDIIITARGNIIRDYYDKVCRAKKILIIGGGLVGVELAGEIATHYKDKELLIAHDKPRLMERQPERASRYAYRFLKKKNVRILLNERVVGKTGDNFLTSNGSMIDTDLVFLCTGIVFNNDSLKRCFKESLDGKGMVKVNKHLQVEGYSNIFAAGDITSINEEKTAQNAEKQACIVACNIRNLERERKLYDYKSLPRIMIISLGKYNGLLTYKNIVLSGIIPGLLKSFVEWKTMIKYKI